MMSELPLYFNQRLHLDLKQVTIATRQSNTPCLIHHLESTILVFMVLITALISIPGIDYWAPAALESSLNQRVGL